MTTQFIPADWLEFATWNRPMIVYSRSVEIPNILAEGDRELSFLESMLADLIGECTHDKMPLAIAD